MYLLFLLLVINFVYAEVNISLDRGNFGQGEGLEGLLYFNYTGIIDKNIPIIFDISNQKIKNKTLDDLNLSFGPFLLSKAKYEGTGSKVAKYTTEFSSPGTEIKAMLDLSEDDLNKLADITYIKNIKFDVIGASFFGDYPTDVKIDIGSDGLVEYTYKGGLTGSYKLIDDSDYLSDDDMDSYVEVMGAYNSVYCEKVKLNPSIRYKIGVLSKKLTEDVWKLKAIITDNGGYYNCDKNNCCDLDVGNTFDEYSCEIDYDVSDSNKDYFICVYVAEGETNKAYFQMGTDTDSSVVRGYYKNNPVNRDYFIKAYWGEYEKKLMTTSTAQINPSILQNYLVNPKCDDSCLVIPINISSSTKGKITLDRLELQFETKTGVITLTSFMPVTYTPEKYANITEIIPLSFFNLFSPLDLGTYTISAQILEFYSDILKFNVTEIPKAVISLEQDYGIVNKDVSFNASKSQRARSNASISSYSWDFGDNITSSGIFVTHKYTQPGNYTIKLEIKDVDGLIGITSLKLRINPATLTLSEELNYSIIDIQNRLDNLNIDTYVKDTATILGIDMQLNSALIQVNSLISQYNSNQTLEAIKYQLDELMKTLPLGLSVNVVNYDGRVNDYKQIPDAITLNIPDVENFEQSVFLAQKDILIKAEAREVRIYYPDKEEDLILVKKQVTGQGDIYEVLAPGAIKKEILTEGSITISPSVYLFSTSSYAYTLEGIDINKGIDSKTFVVPIDLQPYKIDMGEKVTPICGDNICDDGETCDKDCKSKLPWLWLSILIVVLVVLIFYVHFYKGKYSFSYFFNKPKKIEKKQELFKNLKDKENLERFIVNSREKKFTDEQIRFLLRKKGWRDEQIDSVLKKPYARTGI